mmetsp:Transcript_14886/g.38198  ORF Transcript_14886/g.38198 Transcript_14886/m.38198 type:complete len:443 (-) Transcript_14886:762-2090(-)
MLPPGGGWAGDSGGTATQSPYPLRVACHRYGHVRLVDRSLACLLQLHKLDQQVVQRVRVGPPPGSSVFLEDIQHPGAVLCFGQHSVHVHGRAQARPGACHPRGSARRCAGAWLLWGGGWLGGQRLEGADGEVADGATGRGAAPGRRPTREDEAAVAGERGVQVDRVPAVAELLQLRAGSVAGGGRRCRHRGHVLRQLHVEAAAAAFVAPLAPPGRGAPAVGRPRWERRLLLVEGPPHLCHLRLCRLRAPAQIINLALLLLGQPMHLALHRALHLRLLRRNLLPQPGHLRRGAAGATRRRAVRVVVAVVFARRLPPHPGRRAVVGGMVGLRRRRVRRAVRRMAAVAWRTVVRMRLWRRVGRPPVVLHVRWRLGRAVHARGWRPRVAVPRGRGAPGGLLRLRLDVCLLRQAPHLVRLRRRLGLLALALPLKRRLELLLLARQPL